MNESLYDYVRHHCAKLVGKKIYIRFRCDRQDGVGESTNDSWMMGRIDNILYHDGTHAIGILSGTETVSIFSDSNVFYHPNIFKYQKVIITVVSLTVGDKKYDMRP